jgi:hypothetical protein
MTSKLLSGSCVHSHCHFLIIWNQHPLKCYFCEVTLVIFPNSVLPVLLPSPLSLKSCADLCDQRHGCPFNHMQTLYAICCHYAIIRHQLLNLNGGKHFFFLTLNPLLNWTQSPLFQLHTSACLMNGS